MIQQELDGGFDVLDKVRRFCVRGRGQKLMDKPDKKLEIFSKSFNIIVQTRSRVFAVKSVLIFIK